MNWHVALVKSKQEKFELISLIRDKWDVINGKFLPSLTKQMKDSAWKEIFNTCESKGHQIHFCNHWWFYVFINPISSFALVCQLSRPVKHWWGWGSLPPRNFQGQGSLAPYKFLLIGGRPLPQEIFAENEPKMNFKLFFQ